jgi:small subunit ribosomal protein S10
MKLRVVLKSFNKEAMNFASEELKTLCTKTDAVFGGIVAVPSRVKKYCVLRSPHVDKDSREHFELRLYKRFLDIQTNSPTVLDTLLKLELPSGVACSLKIIE